MSLDAAFELRKAVKKIFDKKLCLFCSGTTNSTRETVKYNSDFQDFIDTCKEHQSVGTKKYRDLNEALKDKSGQQLKSERFCFHSNCRRTFNRDRILLSRKRKAEEDNDGPLSSSITPSRLSRSSINRFDYKKCLFCQEDKQASLHDIMQESKDNELKLAFEQCPNSLQIYMMLWLVN